MLHPMHRPLPLAALVALAACDTATGAAARIAFPLRDLALGHEDACVVDAQGRLACWGEGSIVPGRQVYTGADNACVAPFVPAHEPHGVTDPCLTDGPMWIPSEATFEDASVRLPGAALTSTGEVVFFPWLPDGCETGCSTDVEPVSDELEIVAFDTFDTGWCGVTSSGEAVCSALLPAFSGSNTKRPTSPQPIPGGHRFVAISTSAFEYVGLDVDGVAWRGLLTLEGTSERVLVPSEPYAWTDRRFDQVQLGARYFSILDGTNYGLTAMCGVERGTGAVWCDGPNDYGQRGVGRVDPYGTETPSATQVLGLPAVDEVAVGLSHVCARDAGDVWCWGLGEWGQLGYEPGEVCAVPGMSDLWGCSSTPGPMASPVAARRLSAGIQYTCAETDADVVCWGQNHTGRLGGPGLDSVTPRSVAR